MGRFNSTLLAVIVGALIGCGDKDPAPTPPATSTAAQTATATVSASASAAPDEPHRPNRPLNVLLLTVDSMRADMPWQGYERDIAPNLTALAKKSVVYPRAYTVASYTAKSVAAMLSGRMPSTLYRKRTFFTEYSKANVFFPEVLSDAGVRTLAGQAHLYFDRGKNLRQGFDSWKLVPGLTWNAETDESVTSPKTTELAIDLLSDVELKSKNFFAWFHYMDPHDKYMTHAESPTFGKRARDMYDNEVHFTDLHIRKLLDFCEKQPWWKDTVVIVSADHGEAFGEHDQWRHAFTLWEVLTHVPLFIHGPGIEPRRIEARRSQIDLAPTIVELLGQEPHQSFIGKSMVPELFGAPPDDREPILLDLPADSNNPPTRAAISGDYKLIEDIGPNYKLYNLKDDPNERKNLAKDGRFKEQLKKMRAVFDKAWAKHPYVAPYGGGKKLVGGGRPNGPAGPPGWVDPDKKK